MTPLTKLLIGVAGVAIYAIAASYCDRTYVDPRPPGQKVRILPPPFERIGDFVVKYGAKLDPGMVIYEDRDRLDPLDPNEDYRGPGRFAALPNGITFSSTDGTDPNTARHHYWLVLP